MKSPLAQNRPQQAAVDHQGHRPATYTKAWTSIPIIYTRDTQLELTEQIFAPIDEVEFNKRIRDPAAGLNK